MNIVILDDYQDAVRKLECAARLEAYQAKVYTNTVKGIGQLSVRLRDADILVVIRERTQFPRLLLEKLPKLRLICQTGPVGSHIDIEACTKLGIAVAEGVAGPAANLRLDAALLIRRKHFIETDMQDSGACCQIAEAYFSKNRCLAGAWWTLDRDLVGFS